MKYLLYLFVILLGIIAFSKCDECDEVMNAFIKKYNPLDLTNPVSNSGTGYNDFGKYDLCLDNKFKYYLNKIVFHVPDEFVSNFEAYIGLCVPEICYKDEKFEYWKSFINEYAKIPLEDITVIKPLEENALHATLDGVSITFLSITFSLLLFTSGIVKFIMDYFNKSENSVKVTDKRESEKEHLINNNISTNLNNSDSMMYNFPSIQENLIGRNRSISAFIDTCFDINRNWELLFEIPKEKDLRCVQGIKTISMFFVIILTMLQIFTSYPIPIRNPEGTLEYVKNFFWQFLFNNTFCYDCLFFLSAFYFSYKATKQIINKERNTIMDVAQKLFFKFIRWYPAYLFIFFSYWKLFIYSLDGPVSGYLFNNEIKSCSQEWPFIVTLTQDFFYGFYKESNHNYHCFGWSWFIAAYLHYYIVGLVLLYIYQKKPKIFYGVFGAICAVVIGVELWVLIANNFGVTWYEQKMKNQDYYFELYFSRFYIRISPYLIGIIVGVLYANHRKKEFQDGNSNDTFKQNFEKNIIPKTIYYLSGLAIMILIIVTTFAAYNKSGDDVFIKTWPKAFEVIYNFLSRKAFVLALFLLMTPLLRKNFYYFGGFLNDEFYGHLSKISLTTFLIHPTVVRYILLNPRYQIYFDGWYILFYGISSIALSYVLGLILTLFFEMPMIGIKKFFKNNQKEKLIEE